MQYFEDCECEGVLFLTFKGEGGSILTSKWAGWQYFGQAARDPPIMGSGEKVVVTVIAACN